MFNRIAKEVSEPKRDTAWTEHKTRISNRESQTATEIMSTNLKSQLKRTTAKREVQITESTDSKTLDSKRKSAKRDSESQRYFETQSVQVQFWWWWCCPAAVQFQNANR